MGQEQQTDETKTAACHLTRMGRDAMNLVEFPLTLLGDRAPRGCKTLVFEDRIRDRGQGKYVTRRLTVSGSDRFGLPTALDDEVSLGLLQLTKASNFVSRRVPFNRYQLIRVLGWRDEGKSYSRLDKSLKRWTGVTLYYENAWRDNCDKRWVSVSFHLLDEVVLHGRSSPRGHTRLQTRTEPSSYFTWNQIVFESFRAGYLKKLDLEFYRTLKLAAAKRIYRFLDKRFHFANELRFDMGLFAREHVGLSRRYDVAQLKRRLTPAIQELEQQGFLTPMPAEDRFCRLCRGKWEVVFIRAPKARKARSEQRRLSELEQRLVERGVSVTSAVRLVRDYPARQIQAKIEVFDAVTAQKNAQSLRNPAGFLVQSIQQDYAPPAGLLPKPHQDRVPTLVAHHGVKRKVTGQEPPDTARVCHVEHQPFTEYLSRLSSAERSELEQNAISQSRGLPADGYRRALESGNEQLAEDYRQVILQQHLRATLAAIAA